MPERFILGRAPVVYTVAQVRFSAIEYVAKYAPEIQDRLRKLGYPRSQDSQLPNIRIGPQGLETTVVPRWEFQNRTRTAGFILAKNFLSFHVTKYKSFDQFCDDLRPALEILSAVLAPELIEHLGLRYIDLIHANYPADFRHFIEPGILGPDDRKVGVTQSSCFMNYVGQSNIGMLSVRALQRTDGLFLPPDLYPLSLAHDPAPDLHAGEKFLTLDLDHVWNLETTPVEFSAGEAIDRLWALHDGLTAAFLASTTEHGWKYWQKGPRV